MGFIYKITNDINNKVYIGQTRRTIEIRWKEHLRHYKTENPNSKLHNAITKYGTDKFHIFCIEECEDENLDVRERYWIEYYDSYKNGYNTTSGGQDNLKAQTELEKTVISLWNQGYIIKQIVDITNLNVQTVRNYLNKHGISHKDIQNRANIYISKSKSKPVAQMDENYNIIKVWESATLAANTLGISRKNISRSCSGNGKPKCSGYRWKKIKEN